MESGTRYDEAVPGKFRLQFDSQINQPDWPQIPKPILLQPDNEHDFMLVSPESEVLMKLPLAPLADESYVFTFHEQGLYTFICSVHTPEMAGQILVLPPARR